MGQRDSRRLAGTSSKPDWDFEPSSPGQGNGHAEPPGKRRMRGVYANQRFSFCIRRKTRSGQAKVANRTREIRPSGMKTGASRNVAREAGLRPMAKAMDESPDPKARALELYPNRQSSAQSVVRR